MKTRGLFTIVSVFIAFAFYSCTQNTPAPTASDKAIDTVALVKQGEYLVDMMGCHDCHSPKRMGPNGPEVIPELMLSGYPGTRPLVKVNVNALTPGWATLNEDFTSFVGPWGQTFAANLTSDPTGIGNWTEDQFRKALTQGKYMGVEGGRMLLPPMPWQNFARIKDEDLKAIFLYLKSTTPVNNIVPAPIPPDEL